MGKLDQRRSDNSNLKSGALEKPLLMVAANRPLPPIYMVVVVVGSLVLFYAVSVEDLEARGTMGNMCFQTL